MTAAEIARLKEIGESYVNRSDDCGRLSGRFLEVLTDLEQSQAALAEAQERVKEQEAELASSPTLTDLAALRARLEAASRGVKEIAQQKTIEEYAKEADPDSGDWEGAYEACVRRARSAIAEMEKDAVEKRNIDA